MPTNRVAQWRDAFYQEVTGTPGTDNQKLQYTVSCFTKNLNAAKPPEQSKGLGGNIVVVSIKLSAVLVFTNDFVPHSAAGGHAKVVGLLSIFNRIILHRLYRSARYFRLYYYNVIITINVLIVVWTNIKVVICHL